MKKLTEKEKAQLTDEERVVYFHYSMLRWTRKLVALRSAYRLFVRNKEWILSLLFILSIIRSSIWYACFGINILAYSSLQDIFISFADYFMSIIVISILAICFYLFVPEEIDSKWEKILFYFFSIIGFILLSWFFLSLFRLILSIVTLLSIFVFLLFSIFSCKTKIALLYFSSFWLLGLSLFQPVEQYFSLDRRFKNYHKKEIRIPNTSFKERNAHSDFISFDYNNIHIDTKVNLYYLIGSNSNYFFILNKYLDETLIIPKDECKNIKSHPFSLDDML